jgi:phosphate transport system substrate-binding protein
MLAVITNPSNPVKELTINQLSQIYQGKITNWKQVGGDDNKITLYGRQSSSGTYTFFMEDVVKGDYSSKMMQMEGNQAILDAIKQDKSGIGYSGIGYVLDENRNKVSGINVIDVAKDANSEYISALERSRIKDYAISRPLMQYLSQKPEKYSAVYKFLMFEASPQGQKIVEKSGFIALNAEDKNLLI